MRTILFLSLILLTQFVNGQELTTFAGIGVEGLLNGPALESAFFDPEQTAVDKEGNIYVADADNNIIRKIDTNGMVSTYAGSGVEGDMDGPANEAQFRFPLGVAVDEAGNVYVADNNNFKIRVIRPDGMVETLAGTGIQGYVDGAGDDAEFDSPVYLAVDEEGILYITDSNINVIRSLNLQKSSGSKIGEARFKKERRI